jgi:hypothetical protein
LDDIDQARWNAGRNLRPPNQKLLVLVSEWGLEHASRAQVARAVGGKLPSYFQPFTERSLLWKTIRVVRGACKLRTIEILPADIGLAVGIETGMIYLDGVLPVRPDEVKISVGKEGLVYSKAAAASA